MTSALSPHSLQLLALADAGPFRRMDAARSIGSAGYADQAITQLLTGGLITVVGQGRHKHYQRARHATHSTEASLEAARTLLRNHPGPLTALQFGPHREAADVLVSLEEAQRVMVGFLAIYSRPATRYPSPDHHPVSDALNMHSSNSCSGIVLGTRTDGAVRLGLPDVEKGGHLARTLTSRSVCPFTLSRREGSADMECSDLQRTLACP